MAGKHANTRCFSQQKAPLTTESSQSMPPPFKVSSTSPQQKTTLTILNFSVRLDMGVNLSTTSLDPPWRLHQTTPDFRDVPEKADPCFGTLD